jgi:protein-tyrosine-phosphatase/DNA-binding transcriptional ArsR family regulator
VTRARWRPVPDPTAPDRVARARLHAALGEPLRLAVVEALVHSDIAPDEMASALGVAPNALAHHLDVLADVGLVRRERSHGDGRRRYLALDVDRLAALAGGDRDRALGLVDTARWTADAVLFVCTANAARSQLAAALWAARSDVPVASAGSAPAPAVAEGARRAAAARGLRLVGGRPRAYDEVATATQLVVSVCDVAREAGIPFAADRLHWSIPDPVDDRVALIGDAAEPDAFEAVVALLEPRIARLAARVARSRAA